MRLPKVDQQAKTLKRYTEIHAVEKWLGNAADDMASFAGNLNGYTITIKRLGLTPHIDYVIIEHGTWSSLFRRVEYAIGYAQANPEPVKMMGGLALHIH